MRNSPRLPARLTLAAIITAGSAVAGSPAVPPGALAALRAPAPRACLPGGRGFLRAHIRGAVNLDVDLRGGALACEGGPRGDGSGIRMSFVGRLPGGGGRLTLVFGIGGAREGQPGRELPTNLTVIFGRTRQVFATQGERNCTVDRLGAARIGSPKGLRAYRLTARGFCIAPANDLAGRRRILVTRFDFAGEARFKESSP